MATEVARLVAVLEADTRKFERDLNKTERNLNGLTKSTNNAHQATSKLDKQILGTGLTMRTVFAGAAGAAALDFMKNSVRAASDLNESINAVNVTFEESAEGILKLGENAASSVGLANSEFNALAVSFSNFVKTAVGPGGDVVGEMDKLTTRIADFASVMNLDVPEAAQKFQSALAGETEAMRRFGIDVSAAAVKQKALELGLGDATGELTEQEKVMARMAILYDETEQFAGDFANTQGDLANATRTFESRLEDVQARIGKGVLPVLGDMVKLGSDLLTILDQAAQMIPGVANAGEVFAGAWNFFMLGLPEHIGDLADWIDSLDNSEGAMSRLTLSSRLSFEQNIQTADSFDTVDGSIQRADFERAVSGLSNIANEGDSAWRAIQNLSNALDALDFGQFLSAIEIAKTGGPIGFTADDRAQMENLLQQLPSGVPSPTRQSPTRIPSVQEMIRVTSRHMGGPLGAGHPAIVGENGPEMFVPQTSGTVINLSQNFQRAEGANLDSDISRGILLSGIGRFIESSPR